MQKNGEHDEKYSQLLAATYQELSLIRQKTIIKSRFSLICKYPFHERILKIEDQLKYAISPQDLSSFRGHSQMIQNAAFFITYIYDRSDLLAKCVCSIFKTPEFSHVVAYIVPSIFGFFSSNEHLDFSIRFYRKIIELAPPKISIPALEPLFMSSITFRFREALFQSFFHSFIPCINQTHTNNHGLIEVYAEFFLSLVIQYIPLMPPQFFEIWTYIFEVPWSTSQMADLLFIRFLFPSAIDWMKQSTGKNHIEILDRVFCHIAKLKHLIAKMYNTIKKSFSCYEVPESYLPFKDSSIQICLTPRDIKFLVNKFVQQNIMPDTVSLSDFQCLNNVYENHLMWISIFPRCRTRQIDAECGKLFQNNEIIEKLFSAKVQIQSVYEWESLLNDFEVKYFHCYLESFKHPVISLTHFGIFSKNLSLQKHFYLLCIEKAVENDTNLATKLQQYNEQWNELMENIDIILSLPSLNKALLNIPSKYQIVVKRSLEILNSHEASSLSSAYKIQTDAIMHIIQISNDQDQILQLSPYIFKQSFPNFFSAFLAIKYCALKNSTFQSITSSIERKAWQFLEASITNCLTANQCFYSEIIGFIPVLSKFSHGIESFINH